VPRPTPATIFGILNIVFGSLYVLSNGCVALCLPIAFSIDSPEIRKALNETPELTALANEPVFLGFFIVQTAVNLIGGALLLYAGIGLLKARPSARAISIFVAIVGLVMAVVQVGVNLIFVPAPPPDPNMSPEAAQALQVAATGCGLAIYSIYPVLLLIYMQRQPIKDWLDPQRPRYAEHAPAGPAFEPWDR